MTVKPKEQTTLWLKQLQIEKRRVVEQKEKTIDILSNHWLILFSCFFHGSKRTQWRAPATFHVHPGTIFHFGQSWEHQLKAPTFTDKRLQLPDRRSEDCTAIHEKNPCSERTGNRCSNGRHFYFLLNRKYIHLK